ncbi:MAG TPA: TonB-dependent receptor [Novosphingobium sp.]|nr:TonB-dependent receptor [Novosphingobium sp.]HZV08125.1 TonB-dependent receptor [Novosphingobium sp.]
MRIHKINRTLLITACSTLALIASPACAQTGAAPAPTKADGLGEIVVTAERHDSTIQKTPIAIAAYSAAQLEREGVTSLAGLTAIAPNLGFATVAGQSIVTIRGISSRDTSEVGDPAVAVSTDGFYNNRPYGLNASLFDLERVEVLRGPQGTLNGRNAVGGAINVVTAKPTKQFAADVSLGYGNYNAIEARGMVNVPVSDRLQLRAAILSTSHDGYRNNAPAANGDDEDTKAGRLAIAFQPTDRFSGLVELEMIKMGGAGQSLLNVPFSYTGSAVNHNVAAPTASAAGWASYKSGVLDMNQKTLRWQFDYAAGPVKITYLGGFQSLYWHATADLSLAGTPRQFVQIEQPSTQNHELRFASATGGRFTWQAGVFYFREDSSLHSYNEYTSAAGVYPGFAYYYGPIATQSVAGYGQASYKLTDALTLTGGLRYTDDSKSRSGGYYIPNGTTNPVSYTGYTGTKSGHWSKLTYHAALDWQASARNMLYAKVDTGYKAGGFDDVGTYQPETVTAFEIGAKNRFWGNKLELNLSAFYDDYSNQQVSQLIQFGDNAGATHVQNAGKSHIYGIEADSVAMLSPDDRLNLTVDWLHAKFVQFIGSTPDSTANVNFAGNALPQSPVWTIAAGYEHGFDVAHGRLTARAETKFTSSQYYEYYNYADMRQGAYTNTTLSLAYAPASKGWQVEAYVHNLENNSTLAYAEENYIVNTYRYAFNPPRTYGIRFSAHIK